MPTTNYKLDDNRKKAYLDALRSGLRRGKACKAAGISRQAVHDYAAKHPEFKSEVNQAEIDACDLVENALFRTAVGGNVTACQVWLYNRSPERWADKRAVQTTIVPNLTPQEMESQLKAMLENIKESKNEPGTPGTGAGVQ